MGRKEANRKLFYDEVILSLEQKGIVHPILGSLEEAPEVYKDIENVIKLQDDLAKPIIKLEPLGVIIG